jgi:hypothetical protein
MYRPAENNPAYRVYQFSIIDVTAIVSGGKTGSLKSHKISLPCSSRSINAVTTLLKPILMDVHRFLYCLDLPSAVSRLTWPSRFHRPAHLEHHFRWTLLKHLANISRSSLFPSIFTKFLIPFLCLSSILPDHGGFWIIVYVPDY